MSTTLLNELEAAQCLRLSRSFLRQARMKGTGPAFIKMGRSVRYRVEDLDAWIANNSRRNTISNRFNAPENSNQQGV